MRLRIVSPATYRTLDVSWIEANTNVGNFVIQDDHAAMVLVLQAGKEFIFQVAAHTVPDRIIVTGGILDIHQNTATLLLDH